MGLEVDTAFFQDPEHRPKPTIHDAGGIPVIDLSPLSSVNPDDAGARRALAGLLDEVEAACRDWGFFQVVNHGVAPELLERMQGAAREFFALPAEEKRRVSRDAVNPVGYYDTEHTKNVRDWKEVFDFLMEDEVAVTPATPDEHGDGKVRTWKNQWPPNPPKLREAGVEYARAVESLAFKLLELISLTLDLPAKRLNGFFHGQPQSNFIRLNHYPPCPAPHLALGVGRHKDGGALTVLAQDDVGGLDVKRKSDGEWVRVRPIPDSYIINVGDIIQVWSNDKYESAEHRVSVNSEKERFSIPFFFNPKLSVTVEPLEELVNELSPPKYEAYNWGVFFETRKNSNFRKLAVENLQISQFRKTVE
uniref:Naringenin,2-oxoglutarate 3-dioxygenase n=1 Tax=Anthurium amnicola TaxID=1678845 RepID=A0A1D1YK47_9ARAE